MTLAAFKLDIIEQPALRAVPHNTISDRDLEETYELFGWNNLPDSIKSSIRTDMELYYKEIHSLFTSISEHALNRRKKVRYWIDYYLASNVSEQFVAEMLAD